MIKQLFITKNLINRDATLFEHSNRCAIIMILIRPLIMVRNSLAQIVISIFINIKDSVMDTLNNKRMNLIKNLLSYQLKIKMLNHISRFRTKLLLILT